MPSTTTDRAVWSVASGPVRRRLTLWGRRVRALVVLVVAVSTLGIATGRIGADARPAEPIAGHVVVAPGQTLWEVAASTAADGVDPREQLAALESLNGIAAHEVDAWTVLLIPAR